MSPLQQPFIMKKDGIGRGTTANMVIETTGVHDGQASFTLSLLVVTISNWSRMMGHGCG